VTLLGTGHDAGELVITITDAAKAKLIEVRDDEPDADRLGLRVEITDDSGPDFRYDLSFDVVTKAALTDVVRDHGGLKVIIPADDVDRLQGATLDHECGGLVMRNPNRPEPIQLGALTIDDATAVAVREVIDNEVNPALAAHGGFITFVGHDAAGKAYVTMGGGCHGCAMSRMTMLQGVEGMITGAVEGVTRVIDATDHSTGENPYYT
jgi:Fe/S biogenesis protein NfuA